MATLLGISAIVLFMVWVTGDRSFDWVMRACRWFTNGESGSTTIRNVVLVIGGVWALRLTVRRINVADRRAETARKSLLYDRYQRSSEMLGGRLLAVRLGGIYALQQLATEHPDPFLPLIVRQYCAFVRHPFEGKDGKAGGGRRAPAGEPETLCEDVRAAMEVIVALGGDPKTRKKVTGLSLDLSGANLSEASLSGADLSGAILSHANLFLANLSGANLSDANLFRAAVSRTILSHANLSRALLVGANLSGSNLSGANLSGAHLSGVDLSGAELCGAILSGADLAEANLSGTDLSGAMLSGAETQGLRPPLTDRGPVRSLTQDQLDRACADPGDPPDLKDTRGPDSRPLSWRGSPCGGSSP